MHRVRSSVAALAVTVLASVGHASICPPPITFGTLSDSSVQRATDRAVARVLAPTDPGKVIGTATVFSSKHGLALTAFHVANKGAPLDDQFQVILEFPGSGQDLQVLATSMYLLSHADETDPETGHRARDIAVVKFDPSLFEDLPFEISPKMIDPAKLHYFAGFGGESIGLSMAKAIPSIQKDCSFTWRVGTVPGDSGGSVIDPQGLLTGIVIQSANGSYRTQGTFVPGFCFAHGLTQHFNTEHRGTLGSSWDHVESLLRSYRGQKPPHFLMPPANYRRDWIENFDLMSFVLEYAEDLSRDIDLTDRNECYLEQAIMHRLGASFLRKYFQGVALRNVSSDADLTKIDFRDPAPAVTELPDPVVEAKVRLEAARRLFEAFSDSTLSQTDAEFEMAMDLVVEDTSFAERILQQNAPESKEIRLHNLMLLANAASRLTTPSTPNEYTAIARTALSAARNIGGQSQEITNLELALAPRSTAFGCAIKVGVMHSLSGTMAISETTLKDTMLMLIEQQNVKGGVLGCEIEAVVVDPASDWPLFAEKARELLTVSEVDVIFGSWTSVSRKSALPVLEELNGLMFYPVQYEGEESSRNVFYTGAVPNQQAIPAVDYFLEELSVEKFVLLGTDYVYPRTTNNILEQYLQDKGIAAEDIFVNYTPFGHSDWATIVGDVVALGEDGKQVGVISTINGDANIGFYKELAAADISADDIPVVAFSVGEEELSGLDTSNLVGHLAAWNYFQSADTPANAEFIAAWKAFAGEERVTNDPMEAHYIGFNMWINAVTAAGTTDVDAVRAAMYGQEFPNLTGGTAVMLPNHHLAKPVLIGEIRADGQFDIISQTEEVPGDPWTDFLPESAVLTSDWETLGCGMYNTETKTCVQVTSNY